MMLPTAGPEATSAYIEANPLTSEEQSVKITKLEPSDTSELVGGFFGYDLPCRNPMGSVPDKVQFYWIKKEVVKNGGDTAVLDAVVGSGWYKGRIYKTN